MFKNLISVFSFSLLVTQGVLAAPLCRHIMLNNEAARTIVSEDPAQQWLLWEQKFNMERFTQNTLPIQVQMAKVPGDSVRVNFFSDAPDALKRNIISGTRIAWFNHPYNQSTKVPHRNAIVSQFYPAYLTASRSVFINLNGNYFTLKMGVSNPHGLHRPAQPKKDLTEEDIRVGINRMTYLEEVHREIGPDKDLLIVPDVALVADKETGHGYMFRDMSFLKSGNYYLPAFSLPYVGREIARLHGKDPNFFWRTHYAQALGRAKAKLLLRYGLQMETPNSQNILIELDPFLMPTGKIVIRDISDSQFVIGPTQGLGAFKAYIRDIQEGIEMTHRIRPYWSNSSWRLDEAGDKSFSRGILNRWGVAHDNAYKAELEKNLGIDLSKFKTEDASGSYQTLDNNPFLEHEMGTSYMRDRFDDYRQKLEKEAGFVSPYHQAN